MASNELQPGANAQCSLRLMRAYGFELTTEAFHFYGSAEVLLRHHSVRGSHEIAQSNPRNQCESFPALRRTCFDQALRIFARKYKIFQVFNAKKQR